MLETKWNAVKYLHVLTSFYQRRSADKRGQIETVKRRQQ